MSDHSLRVFVHINYGNQKSKGDDCAVVFLSKPLEWNRVVTQILHGCLQDDEQTTYSQQEIMRCRIFLLPNGVSGVAAELYARSLRFGIRDDDQLALCRYGEDFLPSYSNSTEVQHFAATDHVPNCNSISREYVSNPNSNSISISRDFLPNSNSISITRDHVPNTFSISKDYVSNASLLTRDYTSNSSRKRGRRRLSLFKKLEEHAIITAQEKAIIKDMIILDNNQYITILLEEYATSGNAEKLKEGLKKLLQSQPKDDICDGLILNNSKLSISGISKNVSPSSSVILNGSANSSCKAGSGYSIGANPDLVTTMPSNNSLSYPPLPYVVGMQPLLLPNGSQNLLPMKISSKMMMTSEGFPYPYAAYGNMDVRNLQVAMWMPKFPTASYPPRASEAVRRVKIQKWLKKREKRKWSNGPAYPVRHQIARSRIRGQNGRFIPRPHYTPPTSTTTPTTTPATTPATTPTTTPTTPTTTPTTKITNND